MNEETLTYCVLLQNSSLIKIGRTKDIDSRVRQIKTANPFVDEVIYTHGDYENYLHRCLSMYRHRGEWFDLCGVNIRDIFNFLIDIRLESYNDCEAYEKLQNKINELA